MLLFLGVAIYMIVGWASMFIAATFRWTYATWLFFSLMTTAAVLLTLTTLILGIVCRINFGKGLTRYRASPSFIFAPPLTCTTDPPPPPACPQSTHRKS